MTSDNIESFIIELYIAIIANYLILLLLYLIYLHTLFLTHVASTQRCQPTQFRCKNGQFIEACKKCDKRFDCSDGSDEANCSK